MSDSLTLTSFADVALIKNPLIVRQTETLAALVQLINGPRRLCELDSSKDVTAEVLAEARSSCVLIVDEEGILQGIVTERDLVRLGIEKENWQKVIAREVMSSPVVTISLAQLTDMFVALEQFRLHRIRHLPVLDDQGQVVGLITQSSLRLVTRPIDLMRFQGVADVMTDEVVTAPSQTSLLEINHLLVQNAISCVVIVEPHGQLPGKVRPVGLVTERDLVQLRSLHLSFAHCAVGQAMTKPVISVNAEDTLLEVQNLMEHHQTQHVVVQGQQGQLLGLVTQTNVLAALNPWELFRLTESLEKRVSLLESEKIALLENRAADLEREVEVRTRSLEEKHRQEQLVNRIANQIRSSLALPKILQATVTQIRSLFKCDRVAVWKCDAQGILTAIAEAKSERVRSQLGEQVDDPCFREKGLENYHSSSIWIAADIHNKIFADCYGELMERLQIRAKILVAIVIKGRFWGLLEASESQHPRAWSEGETSLLQSLATQLTIAIEQAETHQSLADLGQELEQRVVERTASLEATMQQLQSEIQRRLEIEARQEALLAELSDFKFALDEAAILAMTDADGKITYCNDKLCEISGYSRQELIGQTHRVIKSDYHPPEFFTELWQTIKQGKIWKGEICNRKKDGQDYWVDSTIVPFCDAQGVPVQYLAIRIDITPRKLAEQALTVSESRYRHIVETAQEGIWVLDAQGNTTFANPKMAAMLQTSVEAMVGGYWLNFVAPEEHDRAQQLFVRRQAGIAERHEICFQCQDGSPLWAVVAANPIHDDQGQFMGCLGMITDITSQKMASEVINQQLACIEAAIDGIGILRDEKYIYLNQSHLTLLGYDDPAQLIGQSWRTLYGEKELQRFEQEVFPILMRDKHWSGEAIATRKDGSTLVEGLSLTLTEDGTLICVYRDITKQKQAESQLRRTTAELNQFFSLSLDLLCIANTEGYFLRLNQQWSNTFGYSLEELKQRPFIEFVHPDDVEDTMQAVNQLRTGKNLTGFTNRYRCKDGSYRWLEWRGSPSGKIIYCAARDITSRKQYEEKLQFTNQELERATRLKDEFLANMSHELRTPLNAILGLTDGLMEGVFGQLNSKQLKSLNTVNSSGKHLLTLINDILDLSKIEAGKIDLQLAPTNVNQLCKDSLSFVKQLAYQKAIELNCQIPNNLPELSLDERRIRQVLINLLNNAVKFTPQRGKVDLIVTLPSPEVPANSLPNTAYVVHFAVIDNGIGISSTDMSKIFQPFVQIDSALNRQHNGTGLGLALVKRIVELHNGTVEVTSNVNQGSCFSFTLPCNIGQSSPPHQSALPGESAMADPNPLSPEENQQKLILLVEDNEANIQTFCSYLEAKKYRIIVAKDGIAGVRQAKDMNPHLILMDIQLPKLDGIGAIKQIRAEPALNKIPIIALTALAMKGDKDKCIAAGADEYLAKPVRLKILADTIQNLLNSTDFS
ncbi:PAS domain S-box protein [Synechocystis salina LEGE 06155]|nr:PAS domain S-box protein [Synechocystis salina LEGE 06155]